MLTGGSGASSRNSPIVLAADVTTHQTGYKFAMDMTVAGAGQNVSLSGSGAINTGPPLSGSMTAAVGGVNVNERIVGSYVYVQTPKLGDTWGRISLSGLPGFGASSTSSQYVSTDPAAMLDYLRATGTVTDEGPDTLNGVATTHYHAVVDLARYAASLPAAQQAAAEQLVQGYQQVAGSSTFPIDVWIDDAKLVRQVNFELSLDTQSVQASVTYSMSFSDYGPQAAVTAPPASQVADIPAQASGSVSNQVPSAPGYGAGGAAQAAD